MPSRRILLLFRHAESIDLTQAREQVEALRRCAGVGDVLLGVPDGTGIRLLSPWLFPGNSPVAEGVDLRCLEEDVERSRDRPLGPILARALWLNPLSVRRLDALRDQISRACLAEPAGWTDTERASLERAIPLMAVPTAATPFRARGRIGAADTGGPIRILALNARAPETQTMLGRFVHELGLARRQVELLDYREPDAAMPLFMDGLHARHLDPETTDQSAQPWNLVVLGSELPFRARQFSTLTARLWLFSRPAALFHDHRPVSITLDADKLLFEAKEDEAAHFHMLAATTDEWQLTSLRNAEIFAGSGSAGGAPLAALLAFARELEATHAPFAPLGMAERFRRRFDVVPNAGDLLSARQLARRGYEPLADPVVRLSLASEISRLLAIPELGSLRAAAFARFLRRPSEAGEGSGERTSLRKRIDVIQGVVSSREYARITPLAIAAVTRDLVGSLHSSIFAASSPEGALAVPDGTPESAAGAVAAACRALVSSHLAQTAETGDRT